MKTELEINDQYVVLEYWNKKFKRISRKNLNSMFEANKIDFKVK